MRKIKLAVLCAVCLGFFAFSFYAAAGQKPMSSQPEGSLYDLRDDYVVAELSDCQRNLAKAVWEAVRDGPLGTVSVGTFELNEKDARMVMNALDLNYYPFGDGPGLYMSQSLPGRDGKERHEFFVDVSKSREAVDENMRFIGLCHKIGSPYIKEGMNRKQILIGLERAVSDHMSYDQREKDPRRAILSGRGACGTYAVIFQGMCMSYGINCRYIIGYARTVDSRTLHAWNQVKLGKTWYYVDSCWDDMTKTDNYRMSARLWADHERISYPDWFGF